MARKKFRRFQYIRNLYKNDEERNYNRLNMLIKEKIFDIYEYLGFPIREKKTEVFKIIKKSRTTKRNKDHQNRYQTKKTNLKKALYMHIKKLIEKIESEQ